MRKHNVNISRLNFCLMNCLRISPPGDSILEAITVSQQPQGNKQRNMKIFTRRILDGPSKDNNTATIPTGVIISVGRLEAGACSCMIIRYTLFISLFSFLSFIDNIQIFLGLQLRGAKRVSIKYKQTNHFNDESFFVMMFARQKQTCRQTGQGHVIRG